MKVLMDQDHPTVEALLAAIAHSPIVVTRPTARLPEGFDETDVAILDWIAAEGRRLGRDLALM
jgi:hypothetical protein